MYNYLFQDLDSGEDFFVEANNLTEAEEIANEYFATPEYIDVFDDETADILGYDTY